MINGPGNGQSMDPLSGRVPESPTILISTRTVDRIPTPDGTLEIPGGPPNFVVPALRSLGRACRVVTGALATVDVVVRADGEEYIVPPLPPIPLPTTLDADAIILSPIMREIDVYRIPRLGGLVVADLQGFVRQPGVRSGRPDHNVDLTPVLRQVDVIKATTTELEALSASSRAMLSGIILVLTRGRYGAVVVEGDRSAEIEARPVTGVTTIGAGDTFLACFTASLLNSATPEEAAIAAARFTEAFLRDRARV